MTQKIALITGASRGLGKSAALHLAKEGVSVVITYRNNKEEAEIVVNEIKHSGGQAAALRLDVVDVSSFSDFSDRLLAVLQETFGRGRFDFLVNNAGYGVFKPFTETTADDLDAMYAVHLKGPFLLTQTLAGLIEDGGRILNVSSGLTRFTYSGYGPYAVMKGGVEVATRYMAAELAHRQIAVNTIAPGAIETDFNGGVVRDTPEINQQIASITAMGRVGVPDDIGEAIAGLLAANSQWMTGQRVEVSGGQVL